MEPLDEQALIDQILAPQARALFAKLQPRLLFAELKVQVLEQRLRLARVARYGSRSEKLSDLQLALLDEEPSVSSEEIAAESERPSLPDEPAEVIPSNASQSAKKKHPGRKALPAHLPHLEKIVACTAEQCRCGHCGHETSVIGYEETELLDLRPAEYFATVIKREKHACTACPQQGVAMDESRRLSGSNCEQGMRIVDCLCCKEVYVYAMGQEPWLNYIISIKYTPESQLIVQYNMLVEKCHERDIVAERLYGEKEMFLEKLVEEAACAVI